MIDRLKEEKKRDETDIKMIKEKEGKENNNTKEKEKRR